MSSERRTSLSDLDDRVVRTALMSLPSASVLLVDKDLRYRAAVGAAITYYGFEPSKMIGRLVSDTLSSDTFAFVEPALRRALAGETFSEIREITAVGGAAFEMAYGPAVENGDIVGALVLVRDVSVEHRALTDLAASDELYQMLMSLTSDVIALTNPVDSRYTWVSPSALRVVGWRHDELVGRPAYNFVHSDDLPAVRTARQSLLGDVEEVAVTFRYRRPGGGWIWLESHIRPVPGADGTVTGFLSTSRNVTERKRLEAELSRARMTFESAFTAAPIGMALVSVDGRILRVNSALCDLLGHTPRSLLTRTFRDITHPDDVAESALVLKAMLDGSTTESRLEMRFLQPDGSVVWGLLALALVRDDGRPRFFIAQIEDITARKNAEREMERLTTIDALTGLPNRLLLMDRLRHALALARRSGWLVGVVSVDIDRFKEINDMHGHQVGDDLLRQVAGRLESATRVGDTTTRVGGDEFVVLCEQVTAADEVAQVAGRIRAAVARPFTVLGNEVRITASVGVTVGDSVSGESLLREADRSMFTAKRSGPGRIDVYSEAWGTIAVDQLAVHAALAEGLERGELLAFYQPIVDLRSTEVTAREALVRWAHPHRGLLEPASFLGGADRSPLGVAVGEKVLKLACATAASWADGCAVHVNVSARHLAEPGFVAFVEQCLADSGLAPSRLVLEITESLVLAASRSTLTSTGALSDMGVGLCLDDFGTGYSSVTALHKLPIGGFKIDRSFITGVPENTTSASLVDGLISLGTGMGLDVVAEGIETREQAEWLAAHGCPSGQGFLFGRPVEA